MYLASRRGFYQAVARTTAHGAPFGPSAPRTNLLLPRNTPPTACGANSSSSSSSTISTIRFCSSRGAFSRSAAGYRGASLSSLSTEAGGAASGGPAAAAGPEQGQKIDPAGPKTTGSSGSGHSSPPQPPASGNRINVLTLAGGALLFAGGYFGAQLLKGAGSSSEKKTSVRSDVRSLCMYAYYKYDNSIN